MMKALFCGCLAAAAMMLGIRNADAQATQAVVVSACGTPPATYTAGNSLPLTQDTSGKLCDAGGGGGSGTVTSVSVTSANGMAGTVATATTTPAITLSTSVTGIVKGNGTALSAATAGTDYVVPGGALGTPSSGVATNLTGTAAGLTAGTVTTNAKTPLAAGSSTGNTLTGPSAYFVCTSACTVTPPVPVAGYQFCVMNDDNVATVITMGAIGSSALYENTARTGYGTAGTGTLTSGGAVGDMICIVGRDATHYLSPTYVGTWVAS